MKLEFLNIQIYRINQNNIEKLTFNNNFHNNSHINNKIILIMRH